jgi:hypothetical protein
MQNEVEMVEKPLSDPLWLNFIARHVQIHSMNVAKGLLNRDMEETREVVLDFLDGYLLWLNEERRSLFKQSFYFSTTFVLCDIGDYVDEVENNVSSRKDAKRNEKTFALTTKRPLSALEARRNLEAYLVLWRSIFTLCETAAHSANRVAQLFDWEIVNNGPVCKLSRLLAKPEEDLKNGDLSHPISLDSLDYEKNGIYVTESDVGDFYQDGMKSMEGRKVNLDDLHESATFRIKESRCKDREDGQALPRLNGKWLEKTFYEPEGVKAGLVALRNYFSIIHFNIYLTLAAWAWFEPDQVGARQWCWQMEWQQHWDFCLRLHLELLCFHVEECVLQ